MYLSKGHSADLKQSFLSLRKNQTPNRNFHAGPNSKGFLPAFSSAPGLENPRPWPEGRVLTLGCARRRRRGTLPQAAPPLGREGVRPDPPPRRASPRVSRGDGPRGAGESSGGAVPGRRVPASGGLPSPLLLKDAAQVSDPPQSRNLTATC